MSEEETVDRTKCTAHEMLSEICKIPFVVMVHAFRGDFLEIDHLFVHVWSKSYPPGFAKRKTLVLNASHLEGWNLSTLCKPSCPPRLLDEEKFRFLEGWKAKHEISDVASSIYIKKHYAREMIRMAGLT